MPKNLSIVFAGTPEFAARHLNALIDSEHNVIAVYTQPDRPAGRGKKLTPSPVKSLALENKIPVEQPQSLKNGDVQKILASYQCDVMVVVAYGLLLPKPVLDIPKFGCINVHGSLLPRWRGAAPIQRAIEAGDTESGITIMQMDEGLDTGDMLLKTSCAISHDDTSASLHDKLSELGPSALLDSLQQILQGNTKPEVQDEALSCYAKKIEKREADINWSEPAHIIDKQIRAFNPFPICFTHLKGERLRIHQAQPVKVNADHPPGHVIFDGNSVSVQCGEGQLELQKVQLPGKKAVSIQEFINGFSTVLQSKAIQFEQAPPA